MTDFDCSVARMNSFSYSQSASKLKGSIAPKETSRTSTLIHQLVTIERMRSSFLNILGADLEYVVEGGLIRAAYEHAVSLVEQGPSTTFESVAYTRRRKEVRGLKRYQGFEIPVQKLTQCLFQLL